MPLPTFTLDALSYTAPDGRRLFEDLSLSGGPGRMAVTGRNGTGKSSLISILAGRLHPTSGSVSVTGRVGLLSQETGDGAGLSVGDLMGVSEGLAQLARIEAGEALGDDLDLADWTLPARVALALDGMGLNGEIEREVVHGI